MLDLIKSVETVLGTIYERYGGNGELIQRTAAIGFSKKYEGKLYYIITDLNGNRIKEANRFLNVSLEGVGYKKREQAFTALKLLYSFIGVFHISKYQNGIDKKTLQLLKIFLKGGKRAFNSFEYELENRKNLTIRLYLSVYREYYESIFNVKNSVLHEKSTIRIRKHESGVHKTEKYKTNPSSFKKQRPPKYIKYSEYQNILKIIDEEYFLRDKIIVRLMYDLGLRIGEVLGITLEDVNFKPDEDGNYVLILRNRISDRPDDQHAKYLFVPTVPEDYKSEEYCEIEGEGFWEIKITDKTLIDSIKKYYENTRNALILNRSKKKRENLRALAKADKVTNRKDIRQNQYLFLNSQNYTPLTGKGWGYRLQSIFEKGDIRVDKGTRKDNLSHRFRHGFAMQLVHVHGYKELPLSKALRHSGTHTVSRYYNPTDEDMAELLRARKEFMKEAGYDIEGN